MTGPEIDAANITSKAGDVAIASEKSRPGRWEIAVLRIHTPVTK
jgi:hypothetical protein